MVAEQLLAARLDALGATCVDIDRRLRKIERERFALHVDAWLAASMVIAKFRKDDLKWKQQRS